MPLLGTDQSVYLGGVEKAAFQNLSGLSYGNFGFVGKCRRVVKYKDRINDNHSFRAFLHNKGLRLNLSHKYAWANEEAELPSVAKYDRDSIDYNKAAFKFAINCMKRHFSCMKGAYKLSFDLVTEQLTKNSSSGYPLSTAYPTKREVLANPHFEPYMYELWEKLADPGDRVDFIWTCAVKSEMRSNERVELNKLRTFLAAPMDFTMCSNRLNLHMNNLFYEMGVLNTGWSAVGISKYNLGWERLYKRLNKHPNGFSLDGSSYDASILADMLKEICEFRIECGNYVDKDAYRMRQLYDSIINTNIILANGDVFQKHSGNPSGSNNTVVDNTLVNFVLKAYCWYRSAPEEMRTYESFMKHVEAALYGDDDAFTVSDEALQFYNAKTQVEYGAELGFKFTAEDEIWDPRPAISLKFLGHGFKIYQHRVIPVPDEMKVLSSLMFGSSNDDVRWQYMRAVALYQEAFYNPIANGIIRDYLHYLHKEFRFALVDGTVGSTDWQQIQSTVRDDRTIHALYVSEETWSKQSKAISIDHPCFEINLNINKMSPISKGIAVAKALEHGAVKAAESTLKRADKTFKKVAKSLSGPRIRKDGNRPRGNNQLISRDAASFRSRGVARQMKYSGRKQKGGMPLKISTNGDNICVKNREMISNINGNAAFSVTYNQQIIPTNVLMFPWLSGFATKFDKYHLKKLKFTFVTRLGTAVSGTGVQGASLMTIIYDADDTPPSTYPTFMNTKWATEVVLHKNHSKQFLSQEALFDEYFVAHGGPTDLTSPGYFMFATYGMASDTILIGSLYVDYEVELSLPRVNPVSLLANDHMSSVYTATGTLLSTAWHTNSLLVGAPLCAITAGATGVYRFHFPQGGRYTVSVCSATTNTTTTSTMTLASTITPTPADTWEVAQGGTSFNDKAVGPSVTIFNCSVELLIPSAINPWTWGVPTDNSSYGCTLTFVVGNAGASTFYTNLRVICHGVARLGAATLPLSKPAPPEGIELQRQVNEAVERYLAEHGKEEVDDYEMPRRPPRLIRSDICPSCRVDVELCKCNLRMRPLLDIEDVTQTPSSSRTGSKK